jgi:hypothetical protein
MPWQWPSGGRWEGFNDPVLSAQAEAGLEAGDPSAEAEARLEARIHEKAKRHHGRRWSEVLKKVFLGAAGR